MSPEREPMENDSNSRTAEELEQLKDMVNQMK